jgi:hypothetical protein
MLNIANSGKTTKIIFMRSARWTAGSSSLPDACPVAIQALDSGYSTFWQIFHLFADFGKFFSHRENANLPSLADQLL